MFCAGQVSINCTPCWRLCHQADRRRCYHVSVWEAWSLLIVRRQPDLFRGHQNFGALGGESSNGFRVEDSCIYSGSFFFLSLIKISSGGLISGGGYSGQLGWSHHEGWWCALLQFWGEKIVKMSYSTNIAWHVLLVQEFGSLQVCT